MKFRVVVDLPKEFQDYEITWYYAKELSGAGSGSGASAGASSSSAPDLAGSSSSSSAQLPQDSKQPKDKDAKKPTYEWKPMSVGDSLKLEDTYRALATSKTAKIDTVSVMNDLYDVTVIDRIGYPVYWTGPPIKVLR